MVPWLWVLFGFVLSIGGGVLLAAGLSSDATELVWASWLMGGAGAFGLLVGTIALGVQIGMRAAD